MYVYVHVHAYSHRSKLSPLKNSRRQLAVCTCAHKQENTLKRMSGRMGGRRRGQARAGTDPVRAPLTALADSSAKFIFGALAKQRHFYLDLEFVFMFFDINIQFDNFYISVRLRVQRASIESAIRKCKKSEQVHLNLCVCTHI